jgi:N-acetylmuramoyl-L-alanine amidase
VKKLIVSTILATCSLWPTISLAAGDTVSNQYPMQMVTEKNTVLRRGATQSYSIVSSIPTGREVTVIDEFKNAFGEVWYRVQFERVTGWSLAENFTAKKETVIGKQAVISENNVAMRKGASSNYPLVKTLNNGNIVKIIDEFTNSLQEKYFLVETSGVKGWVKAEKLHIADGLPKSLPAKMTATQSSPVRRGANINYLSVATLKSGQTVTVIDAFVTNTKEIWYRVDLGNIKGWVPEKVLKNTVAVSAPNLVSGSSPKNEKKGSYQLVVHVSTANVRQAPSLSAKVLTQLKKGTLLHGIATATDEKGATWYKISLANKQIGWVHETVVKENNNSTTPSTNVKKTITTNNAVLYAEPRFNSAVVERVSKNKQVTVKQTVPGSSFNWIQVASPSGKTGWMPEFEVNKIKYVYAKSSASALRRGASKNYKITKTLSANERLVYLYEYNGWIYAETTSGIRGWVEKAQTSSIALNSFIDPIKQETANETYLIWKKTSNFKVSYTILSENRLKITGSFSYAEIPSFSIKGIRSIEKIDNSLIVTFSPGYTFTLRNYTDKLSIKVMERGLKGKKIIIDAGHGAHDSGAIGPSGLKEKDVTLDTALLLKDELEKAGAIVKLTRSKDVFLELAERTLIANSSDYDAFISIHADSYSRTSRGTTTYYNISTNFNGPKSQQLAKIVQKHLVAQLGTYNRGYKQQEFYVNRKNELPSILVELAFISNPNEEALLKTKAFRQKAAVGIRKGLEEYFNNF